jgi:hypothetical protein
VNVEIEYHNLQVRGHILAVRLKKIQLFIPIWWMFYYNVQLLELYNAAG